MHLFFSLSLSLSSFPLSLPSLSLSLPSLTSLQQKLNGMMARYDKQHLEIENAFSEARRYKVNIHNVHVYKYVHMHTCTAVCLCTNGILKS